MAFDGIVTNAIVKEIKNDLIGGKIDKIHQPDKNTIVLGIYAQGKNLALNICIDAHNCRINLTTKSRINPLVAPNFCMLLRKHLIGGRISNINTHGLERLVNIEVETINEFNEIEIKTLIIELMGKHSNIILLNKDNKIIDAIRHIDSPNSYRVILPSRMYYLPETDKIDFLKLKNFEKFYSAISKKIPQKEFDENYLSKVIADTFIGFSKGFVKSVIQKSQIKDLSKNSFEKLYIYIENILNAQNLSFEKIYKDDKLSDYVLVNKEKKENYELNFFIDDFYFNKETDERFTNYRNTLLKVILDMLKKYNNRLKSINSKLNDCQDMDKYKLYGELITANLYRINNKHQESIEVENYYDNNNLINIPLDIKYSPNENAKRYFKKYTKLKNALEIVTEQKKETETELDYIGSVVYELENSSTLEEVQEIFEEISENILFKERLNKKKKAQKTNKKKKTSYAPLKFDVDGFEVYVGRNNKENDWLTFTFANKNDTWFHTKDIHGSHVILKANMADVDEHTLIECARIAAQHSKGKNSSNVPVDYCKVQYVRKPNGAKPGMVIFTNNKTLNVTP